MLFAGSQIVIAGLNRQPREWTPLLLHHCTDTWLPAAFHDLVGTIHVVINPFKNAALCPAIPALAQESMHARGLTDFTARADEARTAHALALIHQTVGIRATVVAITHACSHQAYRSVYECCGMRWLVGGILTGVGQKMMLEVQQGNRHLFNTSN